ncbi:hypothetical protein H4R19_003766 [Coemansia spiralis]|nr:hypothetical protein H4R19_003766 [Coemansia spiralis]
MFCIVIYNKKDSKIGAGVLGSNGMSDFAFGIGLVSQIMSVFFVLGWMFMSYHCRAQVIGRYHVHPKTNILCELMFILTHICLIVSDRTFVSMLPQQIDFTTVVYPLSVAMTVLLGIMTIYLVVKLFSKFICKDEPAVAQENK